MNFIRQTLGRPKVDFVRPYLDRPADEVLIGAALAFEMKSKIDVAFGDVMGLRDQDGTWGVIAAIEEIGAKPLVASVEDIFQSTGAFASNGDGSGTSVFGAGPSGNDNGPGDGPGDNGGNPGDDPDDPGDGGPGPTPTPKPTPTPTPSPTDDECEGNVVECAVEDVLPTPPDPLSDLPFELDL